MSLEVAHSPRAEAFKKLEAAENLTGYKTIFFDAQKELEDLQAALETEKSSKHRTEIKKDINRLRKEISDGKVITLDAKRSKEVQSDNVVSLGVNSSSSSNIVEFRPVSKVKVPEGYDAFPWLNGDNGEIFDFAWARSSLPENVVSLVEEKAKRGRVSELLRSKSAGQVNPLLALGIGGAVAGLGLIAAGVFDIFGARTAIWNLTPFGNREQQPISAGSLNLSGLTREELNKYSNYLTSLAFPTEDPTYGWKASKSGKVSAYLAEFYGATGPDDKFDPGKANPEEDDTYAYENARSGDTKYADRYNAALDYFRRLNGGLGSYPDSDDWMHTRNSNNQVVQFRTLNNEGWKIFFEENGGVYVTPPADAEAAHTEEEEVIEELEESGEEVSTASSETQRAQTIQQQRERSSIIDASGPESFICRDGVKSVADALNKIKKDQCLYDALVSGGFDISRFNESNVSFIPLSQAGLNLNTEYQMTYKSGRAVDSFLVTLTDSGQTNLRIGDKIVNVNQHKVVKFVQDGKIAIMLDWCGNLIFGFEEKVEPTPVPTASPTREPATPAPVPPTPTRTSTPVPPPAEYRPPAPPPPDLIPPLQPVPPGEGFIFKWCDNVQTGLFRQLDPTDYPCDANFRVEFLDPNGNIVIHVLDNVRTSNGFAKITSPQPGMLFRAIERLDLLPAQLNLVKDNIYGRTVPAGASINIRDIEAPWALNGLDILPPPPPPVLPPPPFATPTPEAKFDVCVNPFGGREQLNEFQIRQLAASMGINPNLSIAQLQSEIFFKRCILATPTTSTPTPVVFVTPSPSTRPTIEPQPEITRTPLAVQPTDIPQPVATEQRRTPVSTSVPTVEPTRRPTDRPTVAPQPEITRTPPAVVRPTDIPQPVATEQRRNPNTGNSNQTTTNTGGPAIISRPTVGPSGR